MEDQDHDLLIKLNEKADQTSKDIENIMNFLKDNNCRINNLETWKAKITGVILILPFIVSISVALIL